VKRFIKKLIPEKLLLFYHHLIATFAAVRFGFPSKKMMVIGITGTKGKTSTANFIWSCLAAGGFKAGIITTANIKIGERELLNTYHMTMPGRFTIQRLLAQMVRDGCTHCIVETTSEGIKQYRTAGIYYDIVVFTNLSPEHLEAHNDDFEEYKSTKGKIFKNLARHSNKNLMGKKIEKTIIANGDSQYSPYYLSFPADKKITFGMSSETDYTARNIHPNSAGTDFEVKGKKFTIHILGTFNVYNALPAIIISRLLDINDALISKGLDDLKKIPGRMEIIDEGQNFLVLVDYAHEMQSMAHALQTVDELKALRSKTIILVGAEGGGRDKAKRPIIGELSAKMADYVVVSNVDPYEDDPKQILEDIATVAEKFGKTRDKNLFVIEDRREGIRKALALAKKSDIVLITGKGAEQSIIIGGVRSWWDDRTVTREELKRRLSQESSKRLASAPSSSKTHTPA